MQTTSAWTTSSVYVSHSTLIVFGLRHDHKSLSTADSKNRDHALQSRCIDRILNALSSKIGWAVAIVADSYLLKEE